MVGRVHVVCRANQGRSPVFAELLREQAAARGVEAHITSSGLEARPNMMLLPAMSHAWYRRGHSVLDHLSRVFDPSEVETAEVTLAFEASQRSRIVNQLPELVDRVYTVREATRLVSSPRWDPDWSGSSFVMTRLHRMRGYVEPGNDDTPDPARMRRSQCRRLLAELEESAELLSGAFFGPGRGSTSS